MKFQEAIISVINDFGKDILSNASLQNFLNDYINTTKFLKEIL